VNGQSASEPSEDAMLVDAARDGDRAAFGRLYDRYARMVHGLLLAKVPLSEVDDLVQDVFMIALRRLSTLRESGSFGAWLAAIARNRSHDYHRRSVPEDQLTDDTPDQAIEIKTASGEPERPAAAILEVVKSLPAVYKETLILRLVEGMTGPGDSSTHRDDARLGSGQFAPWHAAATRKTELAPRDGPHQVTR